jgi:hypothetical protein
MIMRLRFALCIAPLPMDELAEKMRKSRGQLEQQIEEGKASVDGHELLDKLAELRKQSDDADDTLVQRGDA